MTSQTGGTVTMPHPPYSVPYQNLQNGYGGSVGDGGSVACSGTITTVFTWVPDGNEDDPPDNVIVTESCTASWGGYGYTLPTGSCNNGLGFAAVYTGPMSGIPNPPFVSTSYSSRGTRYQVLPGEETITITCSPSASASGFFVYASVVYSCTLSPVLVRLSGVVGPAFHPRLIIGKGVTATLQTGPLTPTSYRWSVSGGNPFSDYSTTPPNSSTPDSSTYMELTGLTSASPHFYFAKPTENYSPDAVVSCSAHLAVPSGAQPAGGLDVTGQIKCVAQKPYNELSVYIGTVQIMNNPTNGLLSLMLWGAQDNDPELGFLIWGTIWVGKVLTLSDYVLSEGTDVERYGGWNFTQLVIPDASWGPPDTSFPNNGQQGLDNTFGYQPFWPELYPANWARFRNGDAPSISLESVLYARMNHSFVTYTLYKPPGADTKLVALKNWVWFAAGRATWNGVQWILSDAAAQWGFWEDFPLQPIWTLRHVNQ